MDIVTRQQCEAYIRDIGHDLPASGVSPSLISDVSSRMAKYCGRDDWGPTAERTEYLDGGTQYLMPKYWPVTSIAGIWDDDDHVWDDSSKLDVTDYWIDQNKLGVVYLEYAAVLPGFQNVKLTYTAGYAGAASIPGDIQRAAMMQIDYETQTRIPGRFQTVNGNINDKYTEIAEGLGLLGDARILLHPFVRQVPFA